MGFSSCKRKETLEASFTPRLVVGAHTEINRIKSHEAAHPFPHPPPRQSDTNIIDMEDIQKSLYDLKKDFKHRLRLERPWFGIVRTSLGVRVIGRVVSTQIFPSLT